MRIAVLSDIHGNLGALCAVLSDIKRRGVDATVNLGDILSGPLQPCATAELLMDLNLPTIAGNHERQLLEHPLDRMGDSDRFAHALLEEEQREWLRKLPATVRLNEDVLMVHGTPDSDLIHFLETVEPHGMRPATHGEVLARAGNVPASLILCGHSHLPRAVRLDDGRLVVNPGSVGLQAYNDAHPYPYKVENNTPHARYAVVERGAAGWQVELVAVPYAWELAAATAQKNGRPDWAHALRTGRMP